MLEDELLLGNQEVYVPSYTLSSITPILYLQLKSLQEENKRMKRYIDQRRQSVRMSTVYDNVSMTKEQLALMEERDQAIDDLQFALDEKDAQLEEVCVWYSFA